MKTEMESFINYKRAGNYSFYFSILVDYVDRCGESLSMIGQLILVNDNCAFNEWYRFFSCKSIDFFLSLSVIRYWSDGLLLYSNRKQQRRRNKCKSLSTLLR